MPKRLVAIGAVALVASVVPVATAQADPASPRCHDQGCNGQMPEQAGCVGDDVKPLDSFHADNGALIELRYSPSCDAAWARMTMTEAGQGSGTCNGWNDDDVIRIEGADWQGPGKDSYDNCLVSGANQVWTSMIGFGWNVRACYVLRAPWASDEPDTRLGCTAFH